MSKVMESFFSRGDFRFFWPENIENFIQIPSSWDSILNTGVGKSALGSLWINSYLNFSVLPSKAGLSWEIIGFAFWVLPAILLSFFSAFLLFKYLFPNKKLFGLLSGFIYLVNTYFLIILGGGQTGISLSYSLIPFTLLIFIKTIDNPNLRNSILAGVVLSLQIIFDPRIVYIGGISVLIYLLLNLAKLKTLKKFSFLPLPLLISVLINFFWILPLILTKNSPIPLGFDSLEGFRFFSFADFSHAISLLHPNFPENIFGKTYFLQPEFLLLPILAFSSLLFIKINGTMKQSSNLPAMASQALQAGRNILFFALLGLIGAFFAKGSNEPFGQINEFLFNFLPGMSMFRDPTKWYTLIAISYSVLIPFTVWKISERAQSISQFQISNFKFQIKSKILSFQIIFFLFTILYLIFLVRPLFSGQTQIFKVRNIPTDYILLKDFLVSQPQFFRTLWIPQWQRYGFFSNNHPGVGREELLKGNAKKQIASLKKIDPKIIRQFGIKYIIIPFDSEGEIFLTDRKYDEKQYKNATVSIKEIPWLSEIEGFGKIRVFEVGETQDHFWSPSTSLRINYQFKNPTEYTVQIQNAEKGDVLVFSESYDKNWIGKDLASQGETLRAQKSKTGLNSFVLPENGNYELKISYEPQKWVNVGLAAAFLTLAGVSSFLIFGLRGKK